MPSARAPHTPGAVIKPAFLRTYDQVRSEMYALQAQYPDLVRIEDIGDGSEKARGTGDRDILAIHLTSGQSAAASAGAGAAPYVKPKAVWIAGVHPIETANPELMMQFVRTLVHGYGTDAEATGLLDSRELEIIPMANPDGHRVVEHGYDTGNVHEMQQRKNTSPPRGTDLNRNYDHHWGVGKGSGADPRSNKYRGSAPFSEPESRAIAEFVKREQPGEFIDWHSPGMDVLYPWGDTKEPPPDAAGYAAVTNHVAKLAGYVAEQASSYSTTEGTSDDYVYGELHIPAWTVESGTTSRQHDRELRSDWRHLAPAMWLSAKVADDPFGHGGGPDVTRAHVTPGGHLVSAHVSDTKAAGKGVRAAEMFLDPATAPGTGIPMHAIDGAFDGLGETVHGSVADLPAGITRPDGRRLVYVRAQGADGTWGAATAAWVG